MRGRGHESGARYALSRAITLGIVVVVIAMVGAAGYVAVQPGRVQTSTSTVISTSVSTAISTALSTVTQTVTTTSSSTVPPIKVALVIEGPKLDGSYNQIFYQSFTALANASSGAIIAATVDNVGPSDMVRVASTYVQQGFGLIIANGYDLGPGLVSAAQQYPNTKFVSLSGTVLGANLVSLTVLGNECGYVSGYLAAYMSKTGKIGDVLAFKYPVQLDWSNGYMLGAKQAAQEQHRNITVTNVWTATWTDPSIGLQAAKSLMSSGVDAMGTYASGPGSGMQSAVKQAYVNSTVGPYAMGAFLNQNGLGPFMIGSCVWDLKSPLAQIISDARANTFGNKVYNLFLHDKAQSVVPSSTVPASIVAKVNALQGNITSGQILVPLVTSTDLMPTGTITVP